MHIILSQLPFVISKLRKYRNGLCLPLLFSFSYQILDYSITIECWLKLFRSLHCSVDQGESQKIVHLLTEFQAAYVEQNSARVKAQFRNTDSVMVLAYAIVMLHTDMYSPNVRPQSKMTRDEFVRNLRGVDAGKRKCSIM